MRGGLLKKPDGVCGLCGRKGFRVGGLELLGWNSGYRHRLAKLHLYRFEHRTKGILLRVCVICVHESLASGVMTTHRIHRRAALEEDRGGVGGELGSPTRGTRKEAVG